MEEKRMTIREWQKAYKEGNFDSSFEGQTKAGWWDWFCKDSALAGRLKKLAPVVLGITNEYILDNFYVWFKNNCPCAGPLYDDIRFEPLDETKRKEQYFLVVHGDKRENATWVILTAEDIWTNDCESASLEANRVTEVVKFINAVTF